MRLLPLGLIAAGLLAGCGGGSSSSTAECEVPDNIERMKPTSAYRSHHDGTLTDLETGLMWSVCSQGYDLFNAEEEEKSAMCRRQPSSKAAFRQWEEVFEAIDAVNQDRNEKYDDWRLPNVKELASLVDPACTNVTINTDAFPATLAGEYFTSSPYLRDDTNIWVVDFETGKVFANAKDDSYGRFVRLVRDADR